MSERPSTASVLLALVVLGGCVFARGPASTIETGRGPALAFSPSGDFVATSGEGVRVFRVRDGALASTFPVPRKGGVAALAFSPDARWLAGVVEDGGEDTRRVQIWQVAAPVGVLDVGLVFPSPGNPVNGAVAYTRSGTLVAVLGSASSCTALGIYGQDRIPALRSLGPHLLPARPERVFTRLNEPTVFRADLSPDGSVVAIGREDRDGAIELWETASGRRLFTFENKARVTAFAISKDLVLGATAPNVVRVWSRRDGSTVGDLVGDWAPSDDRLWALAVSADGELAAAGGLVGKIHLWSIRDGRLLDALPGHSSVICALGFSPDGAVLASAGWDGTVKIWPLAK